MSCHWVTLRWVLVNEAMKSCFTRQRPSKLSGEMDDPDCWSPGRDGRRTICDDTWQLGIITMQPGDMMQSYQLTSTMEKLNSTPDQQANPRDLLIVSRESLLQPPVSALYLYLCGCRTWAGIVCCQYKTRQCQVVCKAIKPTWTRLEVQVL